MKRLGKILLIGLGSFLGLAVISAVVQMKNTSPEQYAQQKIERQQQKAKAEQEKAEAKKIADQAEAQEEQALLIEKQEFLAGICSQTYIARLVEPSPSKFPSKNATYDAERGLFRISSYVDTKNTFGGDVRQRYYCEIGGVDLENTVCATHDCEWQ